MPPISPQKPVDYYVLKHGEMFGPFSEEDLRAGLSDGRFALNDFFQVEGRVAWQPLRQILETRDEAQRGEMKGAVAPDWACILKWAWLRLRYNLDEQSMVAGVVCLVMGTLALALAHWAFVFWTPWFVAAAVAGFALVRCKREGHGALLLAAVICLPMLFLIFGPKERSESGGHFAPGAQTSQTSSPAPPVSTPAPKPLPALAAPVPGLPTPPPVVVKATPVPPALAAAPVTPPPATPLPVVPSLPPSKVAAAPTLRATPSPAAPAPESLFSSVNKIAEAFLPFFAGSKGSASSASTAPVGSSAPAPQSPGTNTSAGFNLFGSLFAPAADIDVMQGHNDAFVIVKGSNGSGSGFICRVGDKTWLFTNIHVASEIKQPSITNLDGVALTTGPGEVAAGPDIARMTVVKPMPQHPLEVMTDFEANVHIGDDVAVLGNSGGGGVVTALKGKVVGIGPDRLEVSAEFIPGNSGSPIIHVKTGKVIGIATYLTRRYEQFSSNDGKGGVVVRRFGYRIDKVPAWEPANWIELSREADQLEQISKLTGDIFDFLGALREGKPPAFATDTLRRPATDWQGKVHNSQMGDSDRLNATQSFLNALRFIVRGDVGNAEGRLRYTFFRDQLKKEKQIRDRLYQAFDSELASISSPLSRHGYKSH